MQINKKRKFDFMNEFNGRLQNGISFGRQIQILRDSPHKKRMVFSFILEIYGSPILTLILALTCLWFYLDVRPNTMGPDSKISLIFSIIMGIYFLITLIKIYKKQWTFFRYIKGPL